MFLERCQTVSACSSYDDAADEYAPLGAGKQCVIANPANPTSDGIVAVSSADMLLPLSRCCTKHNPLPFNSFKQAWVVLTCRHLLPGRRAIPMTGLHP